MTHHDTKHNEQRNKTDLRLFPEYESLQDSSSYSSTHSKTPNKRANDFRSQESFQSLSKLTTLVQDDGTTVNTINTHAVDEYVQLRQGFTSDERFSSTLWK
jgi:hypothetical protein